MYHNVKLKRSLIARTVFFSGLLLVLIGFAFLLGSMEDVSQRYVFFAFLLVLTGVVIASFAIRLKKRAFYLFFASFSILAGLFLFLSALKLFPFPFRQAWPLISVFSGIALIPAGWWKYGSLNIKFIVPALAFIVLGAFLLIFSFHIVPFNFKQFILSWWHLLIVLAGILLVLLALGTRITGEDAKL